MPNIAERYAAVRERIARAAQRADRRPEEITLVAVTKTWPVDVLEEAYAAGLRHFGENRTQEIVQKRPALAARLGLDSGVVWHYMGSPQSRQTNDIADYADVVHSVDRLKIARRLARRALENGRILPVFLQVNVSGEESKSGFNCQRWQKDAKQLEAFEQAAATIAGLEGLKLRGLMTMAPWHAEPAVIRDVFRHTRLLAEQMQDALPEIDPVCLSMGMTDDYEIAIEEGATHIRVGRALFGPRHTY